MFGMRQTLAAAAGVAAALTGSAPTRPRCFTMYSSAFKDGDRLPTKMAGNNKTNPNCVGENVSPQLSWSNPPAGTKSYALLMSDPEGRGAGVGHWVAYGIPASVTGFAEGETSKQTDKYVGGKSTARLHTYIGPCTPPAVAAPLHLHPDRDRSRAEGAAARPDRDWSCSRSSTATSRARPASSACSRSRTDLLAAMQAGGA